MVFTLIPLADSVRYWMRWMPLGYIFDRKERSPAVFALPAQLAYSPSDWSTVLHRPSFSFQPLFPSYHPATHQQSISVLNPTPSQYRTHTYTHTHTHTAIHTYKHTTDKVAKQTWQFRWSRLYYIFDSGGIGGAHSFLLSIPYTIL